MMTSVNRVSSLDGFDFFDRDVQQCPFPYYGLMRREEPVFRVDVSGRPVYLINRHDDVVAAMRDIATFSSEMPGTRAATTFQPRSPEVIRQIEAIQAEGYPVPRTMVTNDPPSHDRYRKLVNRAFTPRRVLSWRSRIEEIADGLVDAFIGDGRVEVITQFAGPLPLHVNIELLGGDASRVADFKRWSDQSSAPLGADLTDEQWLDSYRGIVEYQHYFAEQLEDRRMNPRDDLLTALIEARLSDEDDVDDKRPLDMPEMLGILHQLLTGGVEPLAMFIAEAARMMTADPDLLARVRDEPEYAKAVVEEALRLATPVQGMYRLVKRHTTVAGVEIPAGSLAWLNFSSANRDETVFDDPDEFCPARANVREHLTFGHGIHFCLGASLARQTTEVAVLTLARHLRDVRFAADNDFSNRSGFILRGLERLVLEFTPPA